MQAEVLSLVEIRIVGAWSVSLVSCVCLKGSEEVNGSHVAHYTVDDCTCALYK